MYFRKKIFVLLKQSVVVAELDGVLFEEKNKYEFYALEEMLCAKKVHMFLNVPTIHKIVS